MLDTDATTIQVQVVYAEPGRVFTRTLRLPAGTTLDQAVVASGLSRERPDVIVAPDCLGVFGQRAEPGRLLRDGDRVEVYRPLQVDPMQARRRRAGKPRER